MITEERVWWKTEVEGKTLEQIKSFKYLGNYYHKQWGCDFRRKKRTDAVNCEILHEKYLRTESELKFIKRRTQRCDITTCNGLQKPRGTTVSGINQNIRRSQTKRAVERYADNRREIECEVRISLSHFPLSTTRSLRYRNHSVTFVCTRKDRIENERLQVEINVKKNQGCAFRKKRLRWTQKREET